MHSVAWNCGERHEKQVLLYHERTQFTCLVEVLTRSSVSNVGYCKVADPKTGL